MKHLLPILLLLFASKISFSQEHKVHPLKYIFDPKADARHDIDSAVAVAGREHKRVFILVGGDWSDRSINLLRYLEKDNLKKLLSENYVFVKVNFSPGNKNEEVLKQLESPRYEGYPVTIILDENGKKLTAQNADGLRLSPQEYFVPSIERFLKTWSMQSKK